MNALRLALALAVLAAPSLAGAFELEKDRSGAELRWPHGRLTFTVDPGIAAGAAGSAQVLAAAQRAASHWADAAGVRIDVVLGAAHLDVGYDGLHPAQNLNTITLATDAWTHDDGVVATTLVTRDETTHTLVDTDIVLNGVQHCFDVLGDDSTPGASRCDDLENALTHEMGHALGLAHNPAEAEATMFPGSRPGEISKRHLSADDVSGVQSLYPTGADEDGQGGCGAAPGRMDLSLGLLAAIAVVLGRRRRAA
jgi:hypothetical protein